MSIRRPRTPGEILARCGKLPALAAASLMLVSVPSSLLAQEGSGVRDPMRPDPGASTAKVLVSPEQTVDITVKNEDIESVLEMLQIQSQKNIVLSKNVSGKVSATIYKATFDEALEAILYPNGWNYVVQGNFIYVFTQEEYAQRQKALLKREYKVVRLNYLNAQDAKEFVSMLLSKDGGEIQVNTPSKDFTISDKTPVGKDDYALSATLVIYDYPEHIKAVEELLAQLDTKPAQVLVESTILQCSLNEANAFGVDFSVIADMDFVDFINVGGPLAAANSLIRGGTGAANQGVSPPGNEATAITSSPGNTSGPGTFKLGIVGGNAAVFLRALDQVTDTVVLSNPKILALNRQPARVLVGRRVGYLSTTSTDTSTTQSVEFLDTGTQLYFRPFVSDDGNIRLELKPQVSTAEIRTVTDAGGAAVTIPDELTQELVTNVNVRDGQTIVLGGLFTENSTFTRRQVPWLGDIPIIGSAFRGHDDSTNRSEIIFMITPSIVSDASIASAAMQAEADIERIRAGTRQGLLPWSRERMTSALNVEAQRAARDGDASKALYLSQRSLALNPHQPQVYELRERITSEKEVWPNPGLLDGMLGKEARDRAGRLNQVQPAGPDVKPGTPWNHRRIPKEPTGEPRSMSPAQPGETGAAANLAAPRSARGAFVRVGQEQEPATMEANLTLTQSRLVSLRGQIELFHVMHDGELPALGEGGQAGWQPLFDMNLINEPPANAFVGGPNATKVVRGDKPDAAFHTNYGWIFNPETGQLWAAGFDANDMPLARSAAPGATITRGVQSMDPDGWSTWFGLTSEEMNNLVNALNQKEQTQTTSAPADAPRGNE